MSSDSKIPLLQTETHIASISLPAEGFRLVSGQALKKLEIAYETYGVLNTHRSNAIFICSPLTTDAHAAGVHSLDDKKPGWWDDMIGPGKAIDTNRYFVIAQNMLGGCKGTTGPASLDPDTGKPYGSAFPKITVEDMVYAQRLLVEHLGVDVLEAVMGHAQYSGVPRVTPMAKTLFAVDELTGLITATALVRPSRSVHEVEARSVRKKMKDKAFARGVSREDVLQGAEALGVDLDEHIAFVIGAMQREADALGLAGVPAP